MTNERVRFLIFTAIVAASSFYIGRISAESSTSLRFRPEARTVEFYRYGELTYEFQPDDGAIFYELAELISDEPL